MRSRTFSTLLGSAAIMVTPLHAALAQNTGIITLSKENAEKKDLETGWFPSEHGLSVHHSGVHAPMAFGIVDYDDEEPAESRSSGMDNFIRYVSADGKVFATIYIYRPAMADAELHAALTDTATKKTIGTFDEQSFRKLVRFGGRSDAALIFGYDQSSRGYATTAGFAKVGNWIVKVRVSGPMERYADVVETLEAGMAAITLDEDSTATALSTVLPRPCENPIKGKARQIKMDSDERMENALFGGLLGSLAQKNSTEKEDSEDDADDEAGTETALQSGNGYSSWCIADSYTIKKSEYLVYRTEDTPGSTVIAPYGDTGKSFVSKPGLLEPEKRSFFVYGIGEITNYGSYSGDFNGKQYRDILTGKSKLLGQPVSNTLIRANGDTEISLSMGE